MARFRSSTHRDWYETIRMADDVTLIHEPWIKPFFRCNMWHVRGRDRDLLFDTGLGHFSLRRHVPLVSERRSSAWQATPISTTSAATTNSRTAACIAAEAEILADPRNEWTLADRYATDDMFDGLPQGWDASRYRDPACAGRALARAWRCHRSRRPAFEVIHTPGHSPGGIALFERKTGILLSGDIVYDGPLIDDAYHSDCRRLCGDDASASASSPVSVIHGGHFPSFGATRYHQLIDEYLAQKRQAGCHLLQAR